MDKCLYNDLFDMVGEEFLKEINEIYDNLELLESKLDTYESDLNHLKWDIKKGQTKPIEYYILKIKIKTLEKLIDNKTKVSYFANRAYDYIVLNNIK